MFNLLRVIAGCAVAVTLVGCATKTTVYPVGGNTYKTVTTSDNLGSAEEDAKKKAEKTCQDQGRRLVVTEHNSSYNGPEEGAKLTGAVVGALLNTGNLAKSNDDSKVYTTFKCV